MEVQIFDQGEHSVWALPAPQRSRFLAVLALSVCVHGGCGAAFLWGGYRAPFGEGDTDANVISVSLISAEEVAPRIADSDAGAFLPSQETAITNNRQRSAAETGGINAPLSTEAEALALPQSPFDAAILRLAPDLPHEQPAEAATLAIVAPQSSSQLTSRDPTASVPTQATAGERARYARDVALAIGKARPNGVGLKGRVDIEFTVESSNGAVARAKIVRSSGKARLDGLALAAVEKIFFPKPPAGMGAEQLTYRVPFAFD